MWKSDPAIYRIFTRLKEDQRRKATKAKQKIQTKLPCNRRDLCRDYSPPPRAGRQQKQPLFSHPHLHLLSRHHTTKEKKSTPARWVAAFFFFIQLASGSSVCHPLRWDWSFGNQSLKLVCYCVLFQHPTMLLPSSSSKLQPSHQTLNINWHPNFRQNQQL